jgi:drug/metabolite transporter (DMT)-like permease
MKIQQAAILIAVISYVFYHSAQKFLNTSLNPFLATAYTYAIAVSVSLLCYVFIPLKSYQTPGPLQWPLVVMGLSVIGLDVGFILAYRAGWGVSTAPLVTNVIVALVLLPLGVLIFREKINAIQITGILCCVIGLVLISKIR